jgi:hypothetical protein
MYVIEMYRTRKIINIYFLFYIDPQQFAAPSNIIKFALP